MFGSKKILGSERIEWVDETNGIGIIFVMLGHCYLHMKFCFWFFAFHMPLFFVLSGYTFKGKENFLNYLRKKTRTLLVPYAFFAIITMMSNGLLAITHGNKYPVFKIVMLYIIQNRYTLLWFITCLFLADLIMFGLLKTKCNNSKFWLFSSVICGIIFGFYRLFIGKDLPWNLDLAILATAFMCFGKWAKEVGFFEKYRNTKCAIVICVFLTIAVSTINYIFFGKVDLYNDDFGNAILFAIAAITGTMSVILISMSIKNKMLIELGKNSLIYYGLHRIIIDLMYVVYGKLGIQITNNRWSDVVFAIISVCVAIALLTPCNYFVLKYIPWCLGKKKDEIYD